MGWSGTFLAVWSWSSWSFYMFLILFLSSIIMIPLLSNVISSGLATCFFYASGLPLFSCWKWNCSLSRSYFKSISLSFFNYYRGYSISISFCYFCWMFSSYDYDSDVSYWFFCLLYYICCLNFSNFYFFFFFSRVYIFRVWDNIFLWFCGIIF